MTRGPCSVVVVVELQARLVVVQGQLAGSQQAAVVAETARQALQQRLETAEAERSDACSAEDRARQERATAKQQKVETELRLQAAERQYTALYKKKYPLAKGCWSNSQRRARLPQPKAATCLANDCATAAAAAAAGPACHPSLAVSSCGRHRWHLPVDPRLSRLQSVQ